MKKASLSKMRSGLKKLRRKRLPHIQDMDQFEELLRTDPSIRQKFGEFRGKPFYRETVKSGDDEAVIFIIEQMREKVHTRGELQMDGTFSITPVGYKQLLVIFGEVDDYPRPLAFIVMTSRKQRLYK